MQQELKLTFNDLEVFSYLRSGIGSYLSDFIPSDPTFVEIAFNEAVNNAIKHSKNNDDPTVTIKLKAEKGKRLLIRIKDKGNGFAVEDTFARLDKAYHADVPSDVLMKESGRGLMIMNQVMDKVVYNQQGNEVLLMKRL